MLYLPLSPEIEARRKSILATIDEYGTQKAFAKAIGFTESRISRALDPDKSTDRRLAPIERAIAKLQSEAGVDEDEPPESDDSAIPIYRESPTGTGRVLKVYDFKAAAGNGGYHVSEEVLGEYVVDYAELQGMQDGHGFVIPVIGRSMVPDFRPGDRVICMRYRQGWDNLRDAVYLIRLEDVVYIKALQRLPGRRLRVISRNMDEFPSFEVHLDDEPDLEVLAVVWGKFERYYQ